MTEDVKQGEPNKGVAIPGESDDGSLSPREQQEIAVKERAKALGWRPLKEFDKDPADWVPAKEFLARQSFFDKIKVQSKQINSLQADIALMSKHFAEMKDVEYKRALAELKSERKAAIADGDAAKVESMSDQITEIETARKEIKQSPAQSPKYGQEEFENFKQRNSWYTSDPELAKRANILGLGYSQMNPNATPEDVFRYVENEMRTSSSRKVVAPPSPDSGGVKVVTKRGGKLSEGDLTPMQREMMDTFVKRGVLTKEQYLTDLSKKLQGE